ncbi:integrase [Shewanella livingstonensis]|uniref:Integrase n=1 Tax=Shewanella livingstonensis TaxID=150120 RepID=A0A3G8LYW7_9GAMM|nr:integrase [Shewanella livingstonensis]AZG74811.1 integrase [Shewanella livingstonensis]
MSIKLIESIVNKSKTLSAFTSDELRGLYKFSVENSDFRALKVAVNNVTGIYDYNELKPYWLLNDFSASKWYIEIKDNGIIYKRTIDWDAVTLNDNLKLTDPRHSRLLNAFKYWITATDNPRENAGKFKKGVSVNISILLIIAIINSILIHGEAIQLTEQHLSGLSADFLMALMVKYGENGTLNGLYDYTNKVRKFLLEKISCISADEAESFAKKYPYITRSLLPEEKVLDFSVIDRVKACCWLNKNSYYQREVHLEKLGQIMQIHLQGNASILHSFIYDSQIIPVSNKGVSNFDELKLVDIDGVKEFKAIPCVEESELMGENSMRSTLGALKLLNTVQGRYDVSQFPPQVLNAITFSRISEHIKLKRKGRYITLPPQLVFNLIESCFEFCHKYQDSILNSVFSLLTERIIKSSGKNSNKNYFYGKGPNYIHNTPSTERGAWVITDAIKLIDNKLIKIGVKRLSIPYSEDGVFKKRRNNESFFALYDVLIGSIQILTGAIMAKRIDELLTLKSNGNLYPNIDPSSAIGEKTDYELISYLKKSGNGGKHGMNAKIKRPIPRSFAQIIWKLEQFNQVISRAGLNKSKLSLFNNLSPRELVIDKINKRSFYMHVDAVCDYFETPLVTFENGEQRRYYIRQHQLRRFFTMVFFWSKSFDGLDTLRWMLGHTDVQHLYNYITESETGAVLNGVKASYIIDVIEKNKLDYIQQLADVIAEYYGVDSANVSLSTIADAASDYGDTNDYKTIPHIEQLKQQERLESQILELLDEGVISLEPEFFTIEHEGHKINDFTLILRVNKLD